MPQAWGLDDPVLTNSFYPITDNAPQTAAGRAGVALTVSQKYPWPGKRRTKASVAECEAQIALARVRQAEITIEEATRLAYYELWYAEQARRINERSRAVAVRLVELAQSRHAAGGSLQDVLRAQAEVDGLDDSIIAIRRRKAVAQADVAALAGDARPWRIEAAHAPDVEGGIANLKDLLTRALECSPWLLEQRWRVSQSHDQRRLTQLSRYPDFVFALGWQSMSESAAIADSASGRDSVGFSVGVTLPIWGERIDASIREASANSAASTQDYEESVDQTIRQVRRQRDEAAAAAGQLSLYQGSVLPRARRALELARSDYRARRTGFDEVADRFQELLTVELNEASARVKIASAIARLNGVVGCFLKPEEG